MHNRLLGQLAAKYRLTYEQMTGVEAAYDAVASLGFVRNMRDLVNVRVETQDGALTHLPQETRKIVEGVIAKYGLGSVGLSFSPFSKADKLETFLRYLIKHRIQPRDVWFDGCLVFKTENHIPVSYVEHYPVPEGMA